MMGKVSPVVTQLAKASLFCKSLYTVLLIGYLLSLSDTLYHGLAITPRYLLPPNFWLWTVFTYFVVERNIIVLLADCVCVHLCGSVLEPLWTPKDLWIYLSIVNCSVGFLTTLALLGLYFCMEDTDFMFSTAIHGMPGFVGALLVAVKQVVPDSTLVQTPAGRLKNTHLPALAFLGISILALVRILKPTVLIMYLIGSYSGWVYLRYYQPHNTSGTKGDMSDHFAFPSFFPSILQPPMETLSNGMYKLLVRLKVCKPAIRHINMDQLTAVTVSLPGMEPQDAERRRQKALKELTIRLNKAKEQSATTWPDMENAEEENEEAGPVTHLSPGQVNSAKEAVDGGGREGQHLETPVGEQSPIPSEPKLVLQSGSENEQ